MPVATRANESVQQEERPALACELVVDARAKDLDEPVLYGASGKRRVADWTPERSARSRGLYGRFPAFAGKQSPAYLNRTARARQRSSPPLPNGRRCALEGRNCIIVPCYNKMN
jgi:hypothetical protein